MKMRCPFRHLLYQPGVGMYKDPTNIDGAACLYSDRLAACFPSSSQDQSEKDILKVAGIIGMKPGIATQVVSMLPPYQPAH
jgi:hypothetical protein